MYDVHMYDEPHCTSTVFPQFWNHWVRGIVIVLTLFLYYYFINAVQSVDEGSKIIIYFYQHILAVFQVLHDKKCAKCLLPPISLKPLVIFMYQD